MCELFECGREGDAMAAPTVVELDQLDAVNVGRVIEHVSAEVGVGQDSDFGALVVVKGAARQAREGRQWRHDSDQSHDNHEDYEHVIDQRLGQQFGPESDRRCRHLFESHLTHISRKL